MECNKEEAIRAKIIAEKKMETKDFIGARKVAIKAQLLDPDLENILKVICVCDVHCSAESKNLGNDKDWYAILQLEQSADEVHIKKQYRKLALLLHPDKNKFPGAESAFKLIGEAQRILLDKEKRSFYDSRYRVFSHNKVPNNKPQPNRNANFVRQPWGPTNMNNASSHVRWQPNPQAPSKPSAGWESFTTTCPFCACQFQQYKDGPNKVLQCHSCKKLVGAPDMYAQWAKSIPNQTATYTRVDISNQGVNRGASNGKYQADSGLQSHMPGGFAKFGPGKEGGRSKKTNEFNMKAGKVNRGSSVGSNPEKKDIGKRGKKRAVEESSDSFLSDSSSTDSEDEEVETKSSRMEDDINRRRSSRSRRHVSYNENNGSDDDIFTSNTPLKTESTDFTKPPGFAEETGEDGIDEANGNDPVAEDNLQSGKFDNGCAPDPKTNASPEAPQVLEVPDPDFTNFDENRKADSFKAGQVWAIFDEKEAMPRFYAVIKRVYKSSRFRLQITWLEADPDDGDELLWVNNELPYPCGTFTFGNTETITALDTLSHLVRREKGCDKDTVNIYPMKDEIWALLGNWSRDWISNPVNHEEYEYEFVEVLSDYDATEGIRVAPLYKQKDFACLFCRQGGDEIKIPPTELLRFSHSVPFNRLVPPFNKLDGTEREDVPPGSIELDPASVPLSLLKK